MMMRVCLVSGVAAILLRFATACGDDGEGAAPAAIDAGRNLDSGAVECGDAADCSGQTFAVLCATGRCSECTSAADCRANPMALGPECNTSRGYCECKGDVDCEDNANGPTCNVITHSCGCVSDRDCTDSQICLLQPYLGGGVRTCQPP
jgi:hypothetical protein